jgi:hypothetical protein
MNVSLRDSAEALCALEDKIATLLVDEPFHVAHARSDVSYFDCLPLSATFFDQLIERPVASSVTHHNVENCALFCADFT